MHWEQLYKCALIIRFWRTCQRFINEPCWYLPSFRIATKEPEAATVPKFQRAIDKNIFDTVGVNELYLKADPLTALILAFISDKGHFQASVILLDRVVFW